MKYSIAVACLLNSAQAVRFYTQNELSDTEVKEQLAPVMYSQGVWKEGQPKATFSKALNSIEKGVSLDEREIGETFRPTTHSNKVVIQPDEVKMTKEQEQRLMTDSSSQNIIHHTKPEDVYHEPIVTKQASQLKNDYKSNQFAGHFSQYVDDKDLDDKFSSSELDKITNVQLNDHQLPTTPDVGVRDTSAGQHDTAWYPGVRTFYPYESKNDYAQQEQNQLPTTADVGKRNIGAGQHATEWYPGFRGFYDYENKNDFAQQNQLPTTADVGQRDTGAGQHDTAWYPGRRAFYPYESKNDYAQLPDVGTRDHSSVHSAHAWYPGDRRHYDFESEYDHAQVEAKQEY